MSSSVSMLSLQAELSSARGAASDLFLGSALLPAYFGGGSPPSASAAPPAAAPLSPRLPQWLPPQLAPVPSLAAPPGALSSPQTATADPPGAAALVALLARELNAAKAEAVVGRALVLQHEHNSQLLQRENILLLDAVQAASSAEKDSASALSARQDQQSQPPTLQQNSDGIPARALLPPDEGRSSDVEVASSSRLRVRSVRVGSTGDPLIEARGSLGSPLPPFPFSPSLSSSDGAKSPAALPVALPVSAVFGSAAPLGSATATPIAAEPQALRARATTASFSGVAMATVRELEGAYDGNDGNSSGSRGDDSSSDDAALTYADNTSEFSRRPDELALKEQHQHLQPFLKQRRGSAGGSFSMADFRSIASGLTQPLPVEHVFHFLQSVPMFHKLSGEQWSVLLAGVRVAEFELGAVIVRQDDPADRLYVIEDGEVQVHKLLSHQHGHVQAHGQPPPLPARASIRSEGSPRLRSRSRGFVESSSGAPSPLLMGQSEPTAASPGYLYLGDVIGHLVRGDVFGERALVLDEQRAASVVADTPIVRVLVIKRRLFSQFLPQLLPYLSPILRRYSHLDPEVMSLTRHIHRFRRLVVGRDASLPTQRAERDMLMRLMAAFSPELSVEDVLARLVDVMYDLFACERVSVFLVDRTSDPAQPMLVLRVSQDASARGMRMPLSGIAGACVLSGQLVNCLDAYADSRFNRALDEKTGFRTRSILAMPLVWPPHSSTVIAVLQVVNRCIAPARSSGSSGTPAPAGAPAFPPFQVSDEKRIAAVAELLGHALSKLEPELALDRSEAHNMHAVPAWRKERARLDVAVLACAGVPVLAAHRKSMLGATILPRSLTVTAEIYHGTRLLCPRVSTQACAVVLSDETVPEEELGGGSGGGGGGNDDDDEEKDGKDLLLSLEEMYGLEDDRLQTPVSRRETQTRGGSGHSFRFPSSVSGAGTSIDGHRTAATALSSSLPATPATSSIDAAAVASRRNARGASSVGQRLQSQISIADLPR